MNARLALSVTSAALFSSLVFAGCSSADPSPEGVGSSSGSHAGSSSGGSSGSSSSSGSGSSSGSASSSSGSSSGGGSGSGSGGTGGCDGGHGPGCGDGGGDHDSGAPPDAAAGTFGAACTTNTDCQSDDCWPFPGKGGNFCTMPCSPGPCPNGCNNQGQCKIP